MPRSGLETQGEQPAGPRGSHRPNTADQTNRVYIERLNPGDETEESWSDDEPDGTEEYPYGNEQEMYGTSRLQQRFVRPENRQNERPRVVRYHGHQNDYNGSSAPNTMYSPGGVTVPYQQSPFDPLGASANPGTLPQHPQHPRHPVHYPRPPPPAAHPQTQAFTPYTPALHGGFYSPSAPAYAPPLQPPNDFYPPPPPHNGHFPPATYMHGAHFPAERRPRPGYPDYGTSEELQYKQKYWEQQDRIRQLESEREEESARLWELEQEKKQKAAKHRKMKERQEQQKSFRRILKVELDKRGMKHEATFPSRSEPATWGREQDHLNDTIESARRYQLENKQGFELVDLYELLLQQKGRREERSNEGSTYSGRYGRRRLGGEATGSELITVREELLLDIVDRVDGDTRRDLLRQLWRDHNMSTASSVIERGPRQIGTGGYFDEERGRKTPSIPPSSVLRDANTRLNLSHLGEISHRPYSVRQTNGLRPGDLHATQSGDQGNSYQDSGFHYPERPQTGKQYYEPQHFEPLSQRGPTFRPFPENTAETPLSETVQGLHGERGNKMREGGTIPQRSGINGEEHSSDEDVDLPEFQNRPRPYRSAPRPDIRPTQRGNAPDSVPIVVPDAPTLRDRLQRPPGILRPPRGSNEPSRRLRQRQDN